MNLHVAVRALGRFSLFFLCISLAHGQEGHPMSGVWVGDWGFDDGDRNRVVIVLDWTGTELAGTINPGPDAIPVEMATVNPDDWSLHLEADGRNLEGSQAPLVIDGKLDDLGTYNRSIAGSWNAGGKRGTFSITRQ